MFWTSWTDYDNDWNLVFRVGNYAAVFTLEDLAWCRFRPRLRFYWPSKHGRILAQIKNSLREAISK
jgi:hypothetical protein